MADVRRFRCKRCGHEWADASGVPPAECPDCGVAFGGGYVDRLERLR